MMVLDFLPEAVIIIFIVKGVLIPWLKMIIWGSTHYSGRLISRHYSLVVYSRVMLSSNAQNLLKFGQSCYPNFIPMKGWFWKNLWCLVAEEVKLENLEIKNLIGVNFFVCWPSVRVLALRLIKDYGLKCRLRCLFTVDIWLLSICLIPNFIISISWQAEIEWSSEWIMFCFHWISF